ncbi:MAG: hypothetical protein AB7O24_18990 [Kofleriaceae bacterium]
MANRCFLVGAIDQTIYRRNEQDDHVYLAGAYSIPLAWLLLFRKSDLVTRTLEEGESSIEHSGDGPMTATAPLAPRGEALALLARRSAWISELFAVNQGLVHHLGLFQQYLAAGSHPYLTMELEEIEILHEEGDLQARLCRCLEALDARSESAKDDLVWLSAVMLQHGFPPITETATDDELANVSRLVGHGWVRPTPWD